jgi:hypothetical protein
MERVVVERTFPEPVEFAEMTALGQKVGWCLEQNGIRFVRSYFSSDRRRMICIYEAPDAESVRRVNRQAKLPFDSVWTASVHGPEPS